MNLTDIEWTDATWNPVVGCDAVSPGCDHCYAETIAHRFAGTKAFPNGFELTLKPERLDQPLHWRKPRRVFVNSMSDLFHPAVPNDFIVKVFDTMCNAYQHTFQVLTKRPQRMASFVSAYYGGAFIHDWELGPSLPGPRRNIWLGTSIELDQYGFRADHLRATPAAIRFLSLEPLLGPLPTLDLTGIDWIIVGGESGPAARPMDPAWACDIRDRCTTASIPFFFKQHGGRTHSAGGDQLDGQTWKQFPTPIGASA